MGGTQTLRVPQDHKTIREALGLARPGDRVLVGPGVYYENLALPDSVVLESVAGSEATTIDGSFAGPVIECSGVSPATVVRGFRLTHGKSHFGGGVRCWDGASPVLEDNIIVENSAVYGGAIAARHGSFPVIRLNRIHRNHAEGSGGGIYGIDGNDQGVLSIMSNTIWGNVTGPERAMGGGIWVGGIDASIRHNILRQNSASGCGGAIWAGFAGTKRVEGNHLEGNTAIERGGALYIDQGTGVVAENTFAGNGAPESSGMHLGDLGAFAVHGNVEVGSADSRQPLSTR
jgi:hypothetical protein